MHTMRSIALALLVALVLISIMPAQTNTPIPDQPPAPIVIQPTDPAQTQSVWQVLKDPDNLTFLTFMGANLADAKTDWKFTGPLTHKEYTITPTQRMSIALGASATALYLRSQFPKLRRPITVAMGVATAYFAGRALANTYSHGAAPGGAVVLTTAGYRSSIR